MRFFASLIVLLLAVMPLHAQDSTPITADNAAELVQTHVSGADTGPIAISPDGATLAVAGARGVWIYDLNDDTAPPQVIIGHTDELTSVAFQPGGELLVSTSADNTARLWSVPDYEEVSVLKGHTDTVRAAAFSPDGGVLATSSADGNVRIWDPASAENTHVLENASAPVTGLAFIEGQMFGITSGSTIIIWDSETWEPLAEFDENMDGVPTSIAAHPEIPLVLVGLFSGTTLALDASNTQIFPLTLSNSGVRVIAYSATGEQFAVASSDETVLVTDGLIDTIIAQLPTDITGIGSVVGLAFAGDRRLFTISTDGQLRGFDTPTGELVYNRRLRPATVRQFAVDPLGRYLAIAGDTDATIHILDATTLETVTALEPHDTRTFGVAFSPDGAQFATTGIDATVRLWDTETFELQHTLERDESVPGQLTSNPYGAAFTPDGTQVAAGYQDGRVQVWDTQTGAVVQVNEDTGDTVWRLVYSPDGASLYVPAGIFDAATLEQTGDLGIEVYGAINPQGDLMSQSYSSGTVPTLESLPGSDAPAPTGYQSLSTGTSGFNADGSLLAYTSEERLVIQDVASGEDIAEFVIPGETLFHTAFSADDAALYVGTRSGLMIRYALP